MSDTSPQSETTNEEQRTTVPIHIVQTHEVLTVTVIYTVDIQDYTYADGTTAVALTPLFRRKRHNPTLPIPLRIHRTKNR
jgi:hypothetical protein